MMPGTPTASCLIGALIVDEDALGTAVEILILASAQCPQEGDEASTAQQKRHRDKDDEIAHCDGLPIRPTGADAPIRISLPTAHEPPASRMALAMTMIEDSDMAIAAMSGVT